MNEFKYSIKRIRGINCPNKCLLTINNIEICFTNSKKGLKNVLNYAYTLDENSIQDKKIKKIINKALGV